MQTHFKIPALLTFLFFAAVVPPGLAQVGVSFRDDFSDMDLSDNEPVSWTPFTGDDRIDALSGDMVIHTDPSFGQGFAILQDQTYTDVRVEAQLRVLDSDYSYAGLGARVRPGESSYIGAISLS